MLEERADSLRAEKLYLDALDYYRAALAKKPRTATIYNKIGIVELLMQRWPEAKKDFENAIHSDRQFSDAYNNLGVIFYIGKSTAKPSTATTRRSTSNRTRPRITATWARPCSPRKQFEKSAAAYGTRFHARPGCVRANLEEWRRRTDGQAGRPRALRLCGGQDLRENGRRRTVRSNICAAPWKRDTRGSTASTETRNSPACGKTRASTN